MNLKIQPSPRSRLNIKPNPTNFSNRRSQYYLNQKGVVKEISTSRSFIQKVTTSDIQWKSPKMNQNDNKENVCDITVSVRKVSRKNLKPFREIFENKNEVELKEEIKKPRKLSPKVIPFAGSENELSSNIEAFLIAHKIINPLQKIDKEKSRCKSANENKRKNQNNIIVLS